VISAPDFDTVPAVKYPPRCGVLVLVWSAGCAYGVDASHSAAQVDAAVAAPDAPGTPGPGDVDAAVSPSGCATPYTGVLATWAFAGALGSQAATTGTATAPGLTVTGLTRAPALTVASGAGSINASNWPMGAQPDTTKYFTLSLTPPAGCTLVVSSIALDAKRSASGPAMSALATSADAFAQTVAASSAAPSTATMVGASATGPLEVRILAYGATSPSGTLRIQNTLTITGALQ
jgi:hypothetical protein